MNKYTTPIIRMKFIVKKNTIGGFLQTDTKIIVRVNQVIWYNIFTSYSAQRNLLKEKIENMFVLSIYFRLFLYYHLIKVTLRSVHIETHERISGGNRGNEKDSGP